MSTYTSVHPNAFMPWTGTKKIRKAAAKWGADYLNQQQWTHYEAFRIIWRRAQHLKRSNCDRVYEPELKRQTSEWCLPQSPRKCKVQQHVTQEQKKNVCSDASFL
jgi:hypothetical protein